MMEKCFRLLAFGFLLAIFLIDTILVVFFQSWVDPFIIMMAASGALIGIKRILAATGITINVFILMGAVMTVGISVSNSILGVGFGNDLRMGTILPLSRSPPSSSRRKRFRPIVVGGTDGALIVVSRGIAEGEVLVINLRYEVSEGDCFQPVAPRW